MLAEGGDRGEGLSTVLTFDLLSAVGVHSLVPAQVGELGIRLQADLVDKKDIHVKCDKL